jgi:hypothetical protein
MLHNRFVPRLLATGLCVAISSHGLLGTIFFEETVNSERYLSMLHNTFVPHRLATGLLLQTHWFMQDEPGHTQRMLFWTFCTTFSTSVSTQSDFLIVSHVGRTGPRNNPDLKTCEYFLWGFLKEMIFLKKPQTIMELRALIIQACNEITEEMCRRVINITVHVEEDARRNRGHIEHLIHTG